jgi:ABC-2 type transport system ATP-binding protein
VAPFAADVTIPPGAMLALIIFGVAEVALLVFCVVDIVRRPAVLGDRKWLWVLLVVLFTIPGSIIYLAIGRVPAPAEEPSAAPDQEARDRTHAAAGLLYGSAVGRGGPGEGLLDQGAPLQREPGASAPMALAERPPAVVIEELIKRYGDATALDGVSLRVPEGSVFGFLGPNGAGKTTTLRILAGLAHPTAGSAHILGHDVTRDADAVHRVIGYLPDVPGFYKWMTAEDYLALSGRLFGLSGSVLRGRVDTLLDLAGLTGVTTRVGGYSRGMKQRLGVAQALINAPRVLLLDEPTSALDPIGRREVLEMIGTLAGSTTVFFSTHILADVERVCDTVAILARGRVVEQAAIDDLKTRHGGAHRVLIEVDEPAGLREALDGATWAKAVVLDGRELQVEVTDLEAAFREVPVLVAARGLALRRFEAAEVSLEEVFVDLVGEAAT